MSQPNIIFITTDQQHARLMSCAGDECVSTPNIDALAASGIRFENTYTANPVCVPCRYALTTGYMPHTFGGLEHNMKQNKNGLPKIADYIKTPAMGHLFRNAGYDTAYGGKLHVEHYNNYTDEAEETFGFSCLSSNCKDDLALASAAFIKQKRKKPFFLWASFIQPHDICDEFPFMAYNDMDHPYTQKCHRKLQGVHEEHPHIPLPDMPKNVDVSTDDPAWMRHFRDGTLEDAGLNNLFGSHTHSWDEKMWKEYRWVYRRYMEEVDAQIGVVLAALKESGQEENTVVVFTSDHGDHDGAHGLTMKRSFYEESVNVPLLLSWKGKIESGQLDSSTLVNNGLDLIPTLCSIAGFTPPKELVGKSFLPDATATNDFVISETIGGRMVRTQHYKYSIYNHNGVSEEQLFDMENDRSELQNLAKKDCCKQSIKKHRDILSIWSQQQEDADAQKYLEQLK